MTRTHVRTIAVPEAIWWRDDLTGADRAIAFELVAPGADSVSAEQWARATWEGPPTLVRRSLTWGWRVVLGLRLAHGRSSAHVLGWLLISNQPDAVTLAARSRLIAAHNVVIIEGSSVLWITLVRYESPVARPIWRLVELVHRIILPYTLGHAGRVLRRPTS